MLTTLSEWKSLTDHYHLMKSKRLADLFASDPNRLKKYAISAAGMTCDYSNNHCDEKTLDLLNRLAEKCNLANAIESLFKGEMLNVSEQRAAKHTLLRDLLSKNVVSGALEKMAAIVDQLHCEKYTGFSGKPINTIVHIGIGGSDLGPKMALNALALFKDPRFTFFFVSNLDQQDIESALHSCNPETTLFIISSKSLTTHETVRNFQFAKRWLKARADECQFDQHFITVTANPDQALQMGVQSERILPVWDWVGGRYSVWSAISLSLAIAIGMERFTQFLAGGNAMDQHFRYATFQENMPVILALLNIWMSNFFGFHSKAIIPYYYGLRLLPDYLQQLFMESLGKSVQSNGQVVDYSTGGILWGGVATNSQHSFHQLLLQGTNTVPIDFVLPLKLKGEPDEQMIANCFAQSDVLSFGFTPTMGDETVKPHQTIPGNRAHNLIFFDEMTPYALGALIALYEHTVYVQSVIWRINAFDQWGVERGKKLAESIFQQLRFGHPVENHLLASRINTMKEKIYE